MLQIKDIKKQYITGDLVQTALDGVSLNLRDNEFVAILGPSGSGKTTLLNVIGGLDRYDSGDLIINGISTKKYTDRDWDSYRNHTIGFVFQSYNLIPHQSVLANVELALTISGISRGERRRRATQALESVGLGNQLHKRPNQMSGGQMQRVAIARALVNDPDILLADEPTGALDSETSVQVMELLKEVSRDRLVVMVTHNPELAQDYANRIVRVKDGRIIDDSNPLVVAETVEPPAHKNMGRSSMSFWTALSLSFNNLWTKKARTLLTAFAGSIGIIGIAAIMALSTGFQNYIDKIQEDTLSNYPLTIQSETADMSSAILAFGTSLAAAQEAEEGTLLEQQMISQMFAQIGSNDLGAFKAYLEENYSQISHTINTVSYSYGVEPRIYVQDTSNGIIQSNPATLFNQIMGNSLMSSMMSTNVFQELMDDPDLLDTQYQVLEGRWPEAYDELVVVLSSPHQLTDYTAYTLGLKDPKVLDQLISLVMKGQEVQDLEEPVEWSYEDLMALCFKLVPVHELYQYNEQYNVWEDMTGDLAYMERQIAQGETLRIVGIVAPREGVSATALTEGVAYTSALTAHVIQEAADSQIVQAQLNDQSIDVFSGKGFDEESESDLDFGDMISVDSNAISSAFGMNITTESVMKLVNDYMSQAMNSIQVDTAPAQEDFLQGLSELSQDMLRQFIAQSGEDGRAKLYLTQAESVVDDYLATQTAQARLQELAGSYGLTEDAFSTVYRPLMVGMVTTCIAQDLNILPASPSAVPETQAEATEQSAVTQPTAESQATEPMATQAPGTEPAGTEAPGTEPGTTEAPGTEPAGTEAPGTEPAGTEAPGTEPAGTVPTVPDISQVLPENIYGEITLEDVEGIVADYIATPVVQGTAAAMAGKMMESTIQGVLMQQLQAFANRLAQYIGSSLTVDTNALTSAFQFNMDAEQIQRLISAMSGQSREKTALANLQTLGYADLEEPTEISVYLIDFEGKEEFMDFLDGYNDRMTQEGKEEQVIRYTDVTGIMMSSVRTIIDAVSYALIAFVAVSLVVSSIMIGIITYISVMERTKEIGVLRAIGASKRNITQVFNAETFIIGLCSGIIGIGVTLLILIPGNQLIRHLTNNPDLVAQLPMTNALVLIALSVVLTLIGGFLPAKKAAKKDPVIALRSE